MDEQRPNPETLLRELTEAENRKNSGKLKIFFAYSAGVGKTYAMLAEAHVLLKSGCDIVIGYVEPHQRPATLALVEGIPQITPLEVRYKEVLFREFDIDSALKRHPRILLVDELAHTNAKGCRHAKRYQDIEELLRNGIDVYTTVNVQHLESLHDTVEAITGVAVRERVPDSVFDSADKVELVDIEPEDLIVRLGEGKVYGEAQAKRALNNFFTIENLVALREIALRRTADRVNITVEKNKAGAAGGEYFTDEHVLMCLSSSPSNAKVIRTATKMAEAFRCTFTALFVETPDTASLSENNKMRLRDNIRLAEQLGAKIVTVYGDEVALQVAEYAKVSGVSKIVLGRPGTRRFFSFGTKNYVDKLTAYAPHIEIYVIPDTISLTQAQKRVVHPELKLHSITIADSIKTCLCLFAATGVGFLFYQLGFSETNIIIVYILASLCTAVITEGKIYSLFSALFSVLLFNFFFTEPRFTLNAHDAGYPITFVIMFLSAFITSTFTKRVKRQASLSAVRAYRTEVLLEASNTLLYAKDLNDIYRETLRLTSKLLKRPVILYPAEKNSLGVPLTQGLDSDNTESYLSDEEAGVASWVYVNNKHAGAGTNTLSGAKNLYMSIRNGDEVFAVLAVVVDNYGKLDAAEKNILISILGECALALAREKMRMAKNDMLLRANSEQLRSNLLRAISHDLRTPLTGIAGGSSFLLESLENMDEKSIKSILTDISNDALWLGNMVENLLNMTRIQDGKLTVSKKNEVVEDIITEAISKVIKRRGDRTIQVAKKEETLLAPMDAQLMIQVLVNLLDNAFKHTSPQTEITVDYRLQNTFLELSVNDDGIGIPKDRLDKIFEPFFTTSQQSSDKQRGMGLGLSICKSIVEAHSGTLCAENNKKGGATFKVLLPLSIT